MARTLGIIIAVLVIIALAYPFGQDAYRRYEVSQHLKSVMSPQERAEFNNWNGDAVSFARTLYDRCEQQQGEGAVQCDRYRYAFR